MSKKNVRDALKDCYEQINTRWSRRTVDKQKQVVLVSRKNLREAFIDSYGRAQEVQPDLPNLDLKVFSDAGGAALEAMRQYVQTSASCTLKDSGATYIRFTQRTGRNTAPFVRAKNAGKAVIQEAVGIQFSKAAIQSIDQGVVRSHEEVTVGMKILAEMFDILRNDEELGGFVTSKTATRLSDKFDLQLAFTKDPIIENKFILRSDLKVSLRVLSSKDNPAGGNARDWRKIRPKLVNAMERWAKTRDWPNQKGSSSIKEEQSNRAETKIRRGITKGLKNSAVLTVSTRKGQTKPVKTSGKSVKYREKRDKNFVDMKFSNKKGQLRGSKVDGSQINLTKFMAMLNEVLPQIVAENMGSPRLNYRTGRFASSVRVTDIHRTKKGVPSIGYTYMKNPYQTFEPGFAQGSKDRDPRTLIDLSIRDAARAMMTGFYTRRV